MGVQKGVILNSNNYSCLNKVEWVAWWESQEVLAIRQLILGASETNLVGGKVITPLFMTLQSINTTTSAHLCWSSVLKAFIRIIELINIKGLCECINLLYV